MSNRAPDRQLERRLDEGSDQFTGDNGQWDPSKAYKYLLYRVLRMSDATDSSDSLQLSEQLNQLAADGVHLAVDDQNEESTKQLALELVQQHHDRINELYYEHDLSDAEAEALALAEADVTPAGTALIMTVTGRNDISEETVVEYIKQNAAV